MIVYESRFLQVRHYVEDQIHENTWFPATQDMDDEQYQQESLNFLGFLLKFKQKRFIADTREMNFGITPDLQTWTNQAILLPIIETGLQKAAFIVSKEMITQLSIEQTMEEVEDAGFTIRYFDNKETAFTWLLAN